MNQPIQFPFKPSTNGQANQKNLPIYDEVQLWSGRSSQIINTKMAAFNFLMMCFILWLSAKFYDYIAYAAIIPCLMTLYGYIFTKTATYTLTNQRLIRKAGVFTRTTFEIELYRIKDVHLYEPFLYRFFGFGNILLSSSQHVTLNFLLQAVSDASNLREMIHQYVEARRTEKGVSEFDSGNYQ